VVVNLVIKDKKGLEDKKSNLKRTVLIDNGGLITEHTLVGTAHISKTSIDDVKETILQQKPDVIALELCESRLDKLTNPEKWNQKDIFQVIKGGDSYLFLLNLYLGNIQKKLGDKVGVVPGQEMLEAYKLAKENNIPVVLADRDIRVTFKRAITNLSFIEKIKLLYYFLLSFFISEDIALEDIEAMKKEDMINKAIEQLVQKFPKLKEVLIDERDKFLAKKIGEIKAPKVVSVVGAGHLNGIERTLTLREYDSYSYEVISATPKKNKISLFKYLVPILFFLVIIYGFIAKGTDVGVDLIIVWCLSHAILSALGALVGGARFLTISTAFVCSPFTAINPFIGVGWIAGLVEVFLDKPKVLDFMALNKIEVSLKGLRKNKVSKILLIVALSNIGSILGTLVAFPIMAGLLF